MTEPNVKKVSFAALLERFFTERLIQQRQVSANTIASYRDTFRLLVGYTYKRLNKLPSKLALRDVDADLVCSFLNDMEQQRSVKARTRNLRLTAIRSFFKYASFYQPEYLSHIQQILAIPSKRYRKTSISFLTRDEIDTLLATPDTKTWMGRRDHAILMLAIQTGLRLSELINLDRDSVFFDHMPYVRCEGKGRKERCTPLTRQVASTLKLWLKEPSPGDSSALFTTYRGDRLSADTIQFFVKKYTQLASRSCPSLRKKKVTPHCFRHTAAMELLEAGVDPTVIALWLGHESVETTQIYIHAHLALKEAALSKINPVKSRPGRYKPEDSLLRFLKQL